MKNDDLVGHLKVKKELISRWGNNKQQPTLNTLNDIAKFLKVDTRELPIKVNGCQKPNDEHLLKTSEKIRSMKEIINDDRFTSYSVI